MKKLLGLGMVILLCLTACSDDDGPKKPSISLDQLAKRWYYSATKVGNQAQQNYEHTNCGKDYLDFQTDRTVKESIFEECPGDAVISTGTYTVDTENNTVNTVIGGDAVNYTIKKLNSKEFEAETNLNNLKVTYIFTSIP